MWLSQKGMLPSQAASFLWSSLSFGPLTQDAWLFCLFEQQDKQSLLWVFLSSKPAWLKTGSLPENVTWNSSGRFVLVWAERERCTLSFTTSDMQCPYAIVELVCGWSMKDTTPSPSCKHCVSAVEYRVSGIWVSAVAAVQTHSINIQYAIDSTVFLLYI